MDGIDLSISVVSYNTKGLVKKCLSSVYEHTRGIKFEVLLVDNSSTDGSIEMLREEFPQVKLIQNRENVGFARANNQAIESSKGRYILLLNSDTVVVSDAIVKMVNFMDTHPEAGVVGCTKLNPDLSVQPSVTVLPNIWMVFFRFFRFKQLLPSPKQRRFVSKFFGPVLGKTIGSYLHWYSGDRMEEATSVDFVTGACFLIRRKTVDDVGLLDENFFMYLEDDDWCLRVKQRGWGIYICPDAQIIHYGGEDFRSAGIISLEHCKSRYYYFEKHYGKKTVFLLKLIIISALVLRQGGLLFLYLFSKGKNREILKKRFNSYLEVIRLSFGVHKGENLI